MVTRISLILVLTSLMFSCKEKSTASEYLASQNTASDGGGDEPTSEDPVDETTDEEGGGEEEEGALTGDPAEGEKINENTCKSCHSTSGLAKSVTLDKSAVSRLDEAYSGANKDNHVAFKTNFEGQKRADLEAWLNTK